MKKCKVAGCSNQHHSKGYCQKHYRQNQRGTLNEPTIDSLLDSLITYEDLVQHFKKTVTTPRYIELFTLLESIIEHLSNN